MDWKLEVVVLPVSDVDASGTFYADQLPFNVDVDVSATPTMRILFVIWLLVPACEAFGFAAGGAALHVDDLPVAECEDLEALMASSIRSEPLGRADDLVVADPGELGLNLDPALAALLDLELQDLTGLVHAVTSGSVLPPEVPVRNATPLVLVSDQRSEGLGVTLIERFGCCSKLIDHGSSMPRRLTSTRVRAHG